jgi:hypothetical protein
VLNDLPKVLVEHHADEEGKGVVGQESVGLGIAGKVQVCHGIDSRSTMAPVMASRRRDHGRPAVAQRSGQSVASDRASPDALRQ